MDNLKLGFFQFQRTGGGGVGGLAQWAKLPAWKVRYRGFAPRSGIQVSKKQNISSQLTRKGSVLWEASVTERARVFGLRPSGREFRILCLEGSIISNVKFDKKKCFTVKGSRGGPPPEKFLISKGFLMQSKAYWALFLIRYITIS